MLNVKEHLNFLMTQTDKLKTEKLNELNLHCVLLIKEFLLSG